MKDANSASTAPPLPLPLPLAGKSELPLHTLPGEWAIGGGDAAAAAMHVEAVAVLAPHEMPDDDGTAGSDMPQLGGTTAGAGPGKEEAGSMEAAAMLDMYGGKAPGTCACISPAPGNP